MLSARQPSGFSDVDDSAARNPRASSDSMCDLFEKLEAAKSAGPDGDPDLADQAGHSLLSALESSGWDALALNPESGVFEEEAPVSVTSLPESTASLDVEGLSCPLDLQSTEWSGLRELIIDAARTARCSLQTAARAAVWAHAHGSSSQTPSALSQSNLLDVVGRCLLERKARLKVVLSVLLMHQDGPHESAVRMLSEEARGAEFATIEAAAHAAAIRLCANKQVVSSAVLALRRSHAVTLPLVSRDEMEATAALWPEEQREQRRTLQGALELLWARQLIEEQQLLLAIVAAGSNAIAACSVSDDVFVRTAWAGAASGCHHEVLEATASFCDFLTLSMEGPISTAAQREAFEAKFRPPASQLGLLLAARDGAFAAGALASFPFRIASALVALLQPRRIAAVPDVLTVIERLSGDGALLPTLDALGEEGGSDAAGPDLDSPGGALLSSLLTLPPIVASLLPGSPSLRPEAARLGQACSDALLGLVETMDGMLRAQEASGSGWSSSPTDESCTLILPAALAATSVLAAQAVRSAMAGSSARLGSIDASWKAQVDRMRVFVAHAIRGHAAAAAATATGTAAATPDPAGAPSPLEASLRRLLAASSHVRTGSEQIAPDGASDSESDADDDVDDAELAEEEGWAARRPGTDPFVMVHSAVSTWEAQALPRLLVGLGEETDGDAALDPTALLRVQAVEQSAAEASQADSALPTRTPETTPGADACSAAALAIVTVSEAVMPRGGEAAEASSAMRDAVGIEDLSSLAGTEVLDPGMPASTWSAAHLTGLLAEAALGSRGSGIASEATWATARIDAAARTYHASRSVVGAGSGGGSMDAVGGAQGGSSPSDEDRATAASGTGAVLSAARAAYPGQPLVLPRLLAAIAADGPASARGVFELLRCAPSLVVAVRTRWLGAWSRAHTDSSADRVTTRALWLPAQGVFAPPGSRVLVQEEASRFVAAAERRARAALFGWEADGRGPQAGGSDEDDEPGERKEGHVAALAGGRSLAAAAARRRALQREAARRQAADVAAEAKLAKEAARLRGGGAAARRAAFDEPDEPESSCSDSDSAEGDEVAADSLDHPAVVRFAGGAEPSGEGTGPDEVVVVSVSFHNASLWPVLLGRLASASLAATGSGGAAALGSRRASECLAIANLLGAVMRHRPRLLHAIARHVAAQRGGLRAVVGGELGEAIAEARAAERRAGASRLAALRSTSLVAEWIARHVTNLTTAASAVAASLGARGAEASASATAAMNAESATAMRLAAYWAQASAPLGSSLATATLGSIQNDFAADHPRLASDCAAAATKLQQLAAAGFACLAALARTGHREVVTALSALSPVPMRGVTGRSASTTSWTGAGFSPSVSAAAGATDAASFTPAFPALDAAEAVLASVEGSAGTLPVTLAAARLTSALVAAVLRGRAQIDTAAAFAALAAAAVATAPKTGRDADADADAAATSASSSSARARAGAAAAASAGPLPAQGRAPRAAGDASSSGGRRQASPSHSSASSARRGTSRAALAAHDTAADDRLEVPALPTSAVARALGRLGLRGVSAGSAAAMTSLLDADGSGSISRDEIAGLAAGDGVLAVLASSAASAHMSRSHRSAAVAAATASGRSRWRSFEAGASAAIASLNGDVDAAAAVAAQLGAALRSLAGRPPEVDRAERALLRRAAAFATRVFCAHAHAAYASPSTRHTLAARCLRTLGLLLRDRSGAAAMARAQADAALLGRPAPTADPSVRDDLVRWMVSSEAFVGALVGVATLIPASAMRTAPHRREALTVEAAAALGGSSSSSAKRPRNGGGAATAVPDDAVFKLAAAVKPFVEPDKSAALAAAAGALAAQASECAAMRTERWLECDMDRIGAAAQAAGSLAAERSLALATRRALRILSTVLTARPFSASPLLRDEAHSSRHDVGDVSSRSKVAALLSVTEDPEFCRGGRRPAGLVSSIAASLGITLSPVAASAHSLAAGAPPVTGAGGGVCGRDVAAAGAASGGSGAASAVAALEDVAAGLRWESGAKARILARLIPVPSLTEADAAAAAAAAASSAVAALPGRSGAAAGGIIAAAAAEATSGSDVTSAAAAASSGVSGSAEDSGLTVSALVAVSQLLGFRARALRQGREDSVAAAAARLLAVHVRVVAAAEQERAEGVSAIRRAQLDIVREAQEAGAPVLAPAGPASGGLSSEEAAAAALMMVARSSKAAASRAADAAASSAVGHAPGRPSATPEAVRRLLEAAARRALARGDLSAASAAIRYRPGALADAVSARSGSVISQLSGWAVRLRQLLFLPAPMRSIVRAQPPSSPYVLALTRAAGPFQAAMLALPHGAFEPAPQDGLLSVSEDMGSVHLAIQDLVRCGASGVAGLSAFLLNTTSPFAAGGQGGARDSGGAADVEDADFLGKRAGRTVRFADGPGQADDAPVLPSREAAGATAAAAAPSPGSTVASYMAASGVGVASALHSTAGTVLRWRVSWQSAPRRLCVALATLVQLWTSAGSGMAGTPGAGPGFRRFASASQTAGAGVGAGFASGSGTGVGVGVGVGAGAGAGAGAHAGTGAASPNAAFRHAASAVRALRGIPGLWKAVCDIVRATSPAFPPFIPTRSGNEPAVGIGQPAGGRCDREFGWQADDASTDRAVVSAEDAAKATNGTCPTPLGARADGFSPAAVAAWCYRTACRGLAMRLVALELVASPKAGGLPTELRLEFFDPGAADPDAALSSDGLPALRRAPDQGILQPGSRLQQIDAQERCRRHDRVAASVGGPFPSRVLAARALHAAARSLRQHGEGLGPATEASDIGRLRFLADGLGALDAGTASDMAEAVEEERSAWEAEDEAPDAPLLGAFGATTPAAGAADTATTEHVRPGRSRRSIATTPSASDAEGASSQLRCHLPPWLWLCRTAPVLSSSADLDDELREAASNAGVSLAAFLRPVDSGSAGAAGADGSGGYSPGAVSGAADSPVRAALERAAALVGSGGAGAGSLVPAGVSPWSLAAVAAEQAGAAARGQVAGGIAADVDSRATMYGESFVIGVRDLAAHLGLAEEWEATRRLRALSYATDVADANAYAAVARGVLCTPREERGALLQQPDVLPSEAKLASSSLRRRYASAAAAPDGSRAASSRVRAGLRLLWTAAAWNCAASVLDAQIAQLRAWSALSSAALATASVAGALDRHAYLPATPAAPPAHVGVICLSKRLATGRVDDVSSARATLALAEATVSMVHAGLRQHELARRLGSRGAALTQEMMVHQLVNVVHAASLLAERCSEASAPGHELRAKLGPAGTVAASASASGDLALSELCTMVLRSALLAAGMLVGAVSASLTAAADASSNMGVRGGKPVPFTPAATAAAAAAASSASAPPPLQLADWVRHFDLSEADRRTAPTASRLPGQNGATADGHDRSSHGASRAGRGVSFASESQLPRARSGSVHRTGSWAGHRRSGSAGSGTTAEWEAGQLSDAAVTDITRAVAVRLLPLAAHALRVALDAAARTAIPEPLLRWSRDHASDPDVAGTAAEKGAAGGRRGKPAPAPPSALLVGITAPTTQTERELLDIALSVTTRLCNGRWMNAGSAIEILSTLAIIPATVACAKGLSEQLVAYHRAFAAWWAGQVRDSGLAADSARSGMGRRAASGSTSASSFGASGGWADDGAEQSGEATHAGELLRAFARHGVRMERPAGSAARRSGSRGLGRWESGMDPLTPQEQRELAAHVREAIDEQREEALAVLRQEVCRPDATSQEWAGGAASTLHGCLTFLCAVAAADSPFAPPLLIAAGVPALVNENPLFGFMEATILKRRADAAAGEPARPPALDRVVVPPSTFAVRWRGVGWGLGPALHRGHTLSPNGSRSDAHWAWTRAIELAAVLTRRTLHFATAIAKAARGRAAIVAKARAAAAATGRNPDVAAALAAARLAEDAKRSHGLQGPAAAALAAAERLATSAPVVAAVARLAPRTVFVRAAADMVRTSTDNGEGAATGQPVSAAAGGGGGGSTAASPASLQQVASEPEDEAAAEAVLSLGAVTTKEAFALARTASNTDAHSAALEFVGATLSEAAAGVSSSSDHGPASGLSGESAAGAPAAEHFAHLSFAKGSLGAGSSDQSLLPGVPVSGWNSRGSARWQAGAAPAPLGAHDADAAEAAAAALVEAGSTSGLAAMLASTRSAAQMASLGAAGLGQDFGHSALSGLGGGSSSSHATGIAGVPSGFDRAFSASRGPAAADELKQEALRRGGQDFSLRVSGSKLPQSGGAAASYAARPSGGAGNAATPPSSAAAASAADASALAQSRALGRRRHRRQAARTETGREWWVLVAEGALRQAVIMASEFVEAHEHTLATSLVSGAHTVASVEEATAAAGLLAVMFQPGVRESWYARELEAATARSARQAREGRDLGGSSLTTAPARLAAALSIGVRNIATMLGDGSGGVLGMRFVADSNDDDGTVMPASPLGITGRGQGFAPAGGATVSGRQQQHSLTTRRGGSSGQSAWALPGSGLARRRRLRREAGFGVFPATATECLLDAEQAMMALLERSALHRPGSSSIREDMAKFVRETSLQHARAAQQQARAMGSHEPVAERHVMQSNRAAAASRAANARGGPGAAAGRAAPSSPRADRRRASSGGPTTGGGFESGLSPLRSPPVSFLAAVPPVSLAQLSPAGASRIGTGAERDRTDSASTDDGSPEATQADAFDAAVEDALFGLLPALLRAATAASRCSASDTDTLRGQRQKQLEAFEQQQSEERAAAARARDHAAVSHSRSISPGFARGFSVQRTPSAGPGRPSLHRAARDCRSPSAGRRSASRERGVSVARRASGSSSVDSLSLANMPSGFFDLLAASTAGLRAARVTLVVKPFVDTRPVGPADIANHLCAVLRGQASASGMPADATDPGAAAARAAARSAACRGVSHGSGAPHAWAGVHRNAASFMVLADGQLPGMLFRAVSPPPSSEERLFVRQHFERLAQEAAQSRLLADAASQGAARSRANEEVPLSPSAVVQREAELDWLLSQAPQTRADESEVLFTAPSSAKQVHSGDAGDWLAADPGVGHILASLRITLCVARVLGMTGAGEAASGGEQAGPAAADGVSVVSNGRDTLRRAPTEAAAWVSTETVEAGQRASVRRAIRSGVALLTRAVDFNARKETMTCRSARALAGALREVVGDSFKRWHDQRQDGERGGSRGGRGGGTVGGGTATWDAHRSISGSALGGGTHRSTLLAAASTLEGTQSSSSQLSAEGLGALTVELAMAAAGRPGDAADPHAQSVMACVRYCHEALAYAQSKGAQIRREAARRGLPDPAAVKGGAAKPLPLRANTSSSPAPVRSSRSATRTPWDADRSPSLLRSSIARGAMSVEHAMSASILGSRPAKDPEGDALRSPPNGRSQPHFLAASLGLGPLYDRSRLSPE